MKCHSTIQYTATAHCISVILMYQRFLDSGGDSRFPFDQYHFHCPIFCCFSPQCLSSTLLRIAWWPSAEKELCSWLSAYVAVLGCCDPVTFDGMGRMWISVLSAFDHCFFLLKWSLLLDILAFCFALPLSSEMKIKSFLFLLRLFDIRPGLNFHQN